MLLLPGHLMGREMLVTYSAAEGQKPVERLKKKGLGGVLTQVRTTSCFPLTAPSDTGRKKAIQFFVAGNCKGPLMERTGRILKLVRGKVISRINQTLQRPFLMSQARGQSRGNAELSVTSESFKQAEIPVESMEFIYPELNFTGCLSNISQLALLKQCVTFEAGSSPS